MPRRKRVLTPALPDRNRNWSEAGLPTLTNDQLAALPQTGPLPPLMASWLGWLTNSTAKRPEEMYCFIYYDIENDKIRRLVAKLLEKQGCIRIQKSVFFARLHRRRYHDLTRLLREIQQVYENNDSIILLPVGEDMLNSLQCIGQNFNLELLTAPRNTVFI